MKRVCLVILFIVLTVGGYSYYGNDKSYSCYFLTKVDLTDGCIVVINGVSYEIDGWNDYVLVPNSLTPGTYEITVTRKDSNLYVIDGYNIYIKTSMCYEYATYQDAILIVDSGGITGKIIFK